MEGSIQGQGGSNLRWQKLTTLWVIMLCLAIIIAGWLAGRNYDSLSAAGAGRAVSSAQEQFLAPENPAPPGDRGRVGVNVTPSHPIIKNGTVEMIVTNQCDAPATISVSAKGGNEIYRSSRPIEPQGRVKLTLPVPDGTGALLLTAKPVSGLAANSMGAGITLEVPLKGGETTSWSRKLF